MKTKIKTQIKTKINSIPKNYVKLGIIAAAVVAVAGAGMLTMSAFRGGASIEKSLAAVSADSVSGADLRIAVIRMDAIQTGAKALSDLRKQKESYETKLRDELTREQKSLEKEKSEIEKQQDVLSREALQRRVAEYQARVSGLQRSLTERAQSIDGSFQNTLAKIQKNDLDPIIEGIIAKKNLSIVIDGRFARISNSVPNLDITDEVITALDKRISSARMEKPKGF